LNVEKWADPPREPVRLLSDRWGKIAMLSFRRALTWLMALIFGWIIVVSLLFIMDVFEHGLWRSDGFTPAPPPASAKSG
jgi:hypothetical protein